MKGSRKTLFFLILMLTASGILLAAADFGESSASLGQFTDDFIDLNNVSVLVDVVRNSTYDAMELNKTGAAPAGWLTGWGYRKEHTITGTAVGAQTDYQVGIKVYYGNGVDGTEVVWGITYGKVYLDSKCKTDFGDIRFTEDDGTTLITPFIERQVDSSYAEIWIKIDIPDNPGTVDFFMYYGNATATTTSDGDAVFPKFIGMEEGNLNEWDSLTGTATKTASMNLPLNSVYDLKMVPAPGNPAGSDAVANIDAYDNNHAYRMWIYDLGNQDPVWSHEVWIFDIGGTWTSFGMHNTNFYQYRTFGGAWTDSAIARTADFHVIEFRCLTTTKTYIDGTHVATQNLNEENMDEFLGRVYRDNPNAAYFDSVHVRKYVEAEPTHTSWGSEEFALGYSRSGYFTTTNYLNYADGAVLVHLTNTTIPGGTGITVEFSTDNSSWVQNDWEPLFGGFESADLRGINYSAGFYIRYNFTGSGSNTPRLYQSRLISTVGVVGPGSPGQNVTGEWILYNVTQFNASIGTIDAGNIASTYFLDGDTFNLSETVGPPGMVISMNFTGIDQDVECLWLVINAFYDGNFKHDFDIQAYNFTSSAWVDVDHITDGTGFEWFNVSIYGLRVPVDFINGSGAVLWRLYHTAPGNVNHDIFIDYIKLHAKIPSDVTPAGDIIINIVESDFPWIAIAIILMCVAYLLLRPK